MPSPDLEQRIANLERANRRWKWIAAVVLGMTVMAAAKPTNEVNNLVRTRRLEVLDGDDKPIITLGATSVGRSSGVEILNDGKTALLFTSASGGGHILVGNEEGGITGRLSSSLDGGELELWAANGKMIAEIQPTETGGALNVYDKTERLAVTLGADKEDRGFITIHDADGKVKKRLVGE